MKYIKEDFTNNRYFTHSCERNLYQRFPHSDSSSDMFQCIFSSTISKPQFSRLQYPLILYIGQGDLAGIIMTKKNILQGLPLFICSPPLGWRAYPIQNRQTYIFFSCSCVSGGISKESTKQEKIHQWFTICIRSSPLIWCN